MRAIYILISGRVQGVGYRWFAEQRAERHSVAGYVRNLPDGTVEVLAQADDAALDGFCRDLRRGPGLARVDELAVQDASVDPELRDFRVRY